MSVTVLIFRLVGPFAAWVGWESVSYKDRLCPEKEQTVSEAAPLTLPLPSVLCLDNPRSAGPVSPSVLRW